eukprot:TRINITY_DN73666_c0_g1_i1.p1 TRINITY_DN73666_c0_g1~~TRINITY_DN73666_c0_g1_i1.p1  ORF type:complete len:137 (-),score=12.43 TRINITY_DN73666_c0_g1_i1:126-536(-)
MYFPNSHGGLSNMPVQVIYIVIIVIVVFTLICCISCYFKHIYKFCCGHASVQWDRLEDENQPLIIGNSSQQNIRIVTLPKNIKLAIDPSGKILLANTVISSSPRLGGMSEVSHTPVLYQTELSTDGTDSIASSSNV